MLDEEKNMSACAQKMSDEQYFAFIKQKKIEENKTLQQLIGEPVEFHDQTAFCKKCQLYTVRYRLRQCRRPDEAESSKYVCQKCNSSW